MRNFQRLCWLLSAPHRSLCNRLRFHRSLEKELAEVARVVDERDSVVVVPPPSSVQVTPTEETTPRRRTGRSASQRVIAALRRKLARRDATVRQLRLRLRRKPKAPSKTRAEKKLDVVAAAAEAGDLQAIYTMERVLNFGLSKPVGARRAGVRARVLHVTERVRPGQAWRPASWLACALHAEALPGLQHRRGEQ